jgi:outer membrane protein assembly factor BamD (BamD/ComL family)
MGGKRGWAWKHVPIYLASLIACAVFACASSGALVTSSASSDAPVTRPEPEGVSYLQLVQSLMRQGDFDGALKESQSTLADSPKDPPGDEALFYMGLIYAHHGNPKKDYQKARVLFMRVIKEFPQSTRAEESNIWIGVLDSIEKAKQVDMRIEEKKKEITNK